MGFSMKCSHGSHICGKHEGRPIKGRKAYTKAFYAVVFNCAKTLQLIYISLHNFTQRELYVFSSKVLEISFLCISRNLQSVQQIPYMGELCKSDLRLLGIEGLGH